MRSISSEIYTLIVLIAREYSGKVNLWGENRIASRPKRDLLSQRDSKFSHEIEASGQQAQDGAQILKSRSIQKEATRIVCVLLTSNAKKQSRNFNRSS